MKSDYFMDADSSNHAGTDVSTQAGCTSSSESVAEVSDDCSSDNDALVGEADEATGVVGAFDSEAKPPVAGGPPTQYGGWCMAANAEERSSGDEWGFDPHAANSDKEGRSARAAAARCRGRGNGRRRRLCRS